MTIQKKTESFKEEIVNLYNQGNSANQIGKQLNFRTASILKTLRKEGIEIKFYKFIEFDQKTLEKEFLSGKTSRELAKKYGCSHETILKKLRGKIKINRHKNLLDMRKETNNIIIKYNSLLSISKIASLYGCSSNIIRTILKENNIQLREKEGKYLHLDEDKIVKEYENGFTSQELASRYKCSEGKILSILKNHAVTMRRRGSRPTKILTVQPDSAMIYQKVKGEKK